MRKTIILALVLAVVMFVLSLFSAHNDVCCMFSSYRERGWPVKVLIIAKGTDSLDEAMKVYSLSDIELLQQGWKLRAGSVFNPAYINIPFNFIFYFVISWGLITAVKKLKRVS